MAYITLFITVPLTLFAVLFAVSNTGDVTVTLLPFDGKLTLGVYELGLGMMGIGFFFGALFVGIHSQKVRLNAWKQKRRAERLEKEIDGLREKESSKEIVGA